VTSPIPLPATPKATRWLDVLLCVPLWTIIAVLVISSLLNSVAYVRSYVDDTAYHIPMAVEIARHRNPYYVDTGSTFTSFWFPAGAETIAAAIISVIPSINSTNLSGTVFFALFLLVSYKFAGIWTNKSIVRLLCVILVGIIPVLLAQTRAFYIDIHVGFLVYLSLYLYALSIATESANYGWLGMGAALLTSSMKYHGLLFCAILFPVGVYCILRSKNRRPARRVFVVMCLCVVFASGWYIRNLLLKGNPIYPLPLPQLLQTLSTTVGLPYQGMPNYPNLSPQTHLPYPLIPKTLTHYHFRPDITDDAFGLGFPIAMVMYVVAALRVNRMTIPRQRAFWLSLVASIAIVVILPFRLSVPRYILFLPAVAALWPSMIAASTGERKTVFALMYVGVLLLSSFYIGGNLIGDRSTKTSVANALSSIIEGRDSDIIHLDFVEQGNLRVGYLGGRYAFIASLYDRNLTNQLVQLHYQDYLLDAGMSFANPDEFVKHVQSLDLDYIVVFDTKAPGAQIIASHFPDRTFVEDIYK
jgi:hypothetical protein